MSVKSIANIFSVVTVPNTFSKLDIIFPYQYVITAITRNVLSSVCLRTSMDASHCLSVSRIRLHGAEEPVKLIGANSRRQVY